MRASHTSIVIVAVVLGAALGLGSYTFAYARGWAYMTDDARACANCHVMNEQYDGWIKSSHRSVAVCNDCHVPHTLIAKYVTKASNGFWHWYHFTRPARSPSQSGRSRRAGPSRRQIAAAATSPSSRPWGRPPTPDPRHLLYPLPRLRGPHGTFRDQRRRSFEVNRARSGTRRHSRLESQCRSDRGGRDGRRPPRQSRHSSSTSWSGRGKRSRPLPRRGAD